MIRLKVSIIGLLMLFCGITGAIAKEVKPTLLVYGDGVEAFAAALQAARSNVPTIWVFEGATYMADVENSTLPVACNAHLLGGIWKDLLIETGQLKSKEDSLILALQKDINPRLMRNALERMLAKQQNLTLVSGTQVVGIAKGKKGLTVTLSNKRKYGVRAMVDATPQGDTRPYVVSTDLFAKPSRILSLPEINADERRTLLALGEYETALYGYRWFDVFSRSNSNVFFTAGLVQVGLDDNSLSLRANLGQAVGAAAAYCSFFKTTADKIDMRKLQTELLTFDARILPFSDISSSDSNFKSLQKIFLVSFFPVEDTEKGILFDGDRPVSIGSVKAVFNSLYSRSQLWFVDKEDRDFELKELLDLIKHVSLRGDEVNREVEKEWSRKLKFKGVYDPEHIVSRYEFAVLVDRYADPYVKAIDGEGKILR
ncbi:FAD-dependent oxidoreductase [Sphingobacterium tabacisoli]|uniref:FAD-dependent oxidoreductase n=1 Tax=Sphingobacterium tabacisoli TaxID=2044855 RepID=A0ABW5KZ26_9SPHI|nr:FAD-dependent oxidoreductase [Sphingobacterium tabacisoli]